MTSCGPIRKLIYLSDITHTSIWKIYIRMTLKMLLTPKIFISFIETIEYQKNKSYRFFRAFRDAHFQLSSTLFSGHLWSVRFLSVPLLPLLQWGVCGAHSSYCVFSNCFSTRVRQLFTHPRCAILKALWWINFETIFQLKLILFRIATPLMEVWLGKKPEKLLNNF